MGFATLYPSYEAATPHRRRTGREALEQHRQQDRTNCSPRDVSACAMMRAIAKGLMRIRLAQRVVGLAIFEDVLIPVGRRLNRHHSIALWNQAAANLRILHD